MVLDRSYQNEPGKQRKIEVDLLKYQSHVFNKNVASHGFNGNTVGLLFGGKEFLPVSMLLFPLQQFTFGLTEFYYWDRFIGYGDDVEEAKRLMLETISSIDDILKDPAPDVFLLELGESSVNIRARWWIKPPRRIDDLKSRDKVISAIKQKLYVENGIDLPYPTRQILFHDQTEETDGDRSRQREGWPAGNKKVPLARSISGSLKKLAEKSVSENGNDSDSQNLTTGDRK